MNEVLGDRLFFKKPQRGLAESRKQGGGSDQEHLKDLKQEASHAGTAAKEVEGKLPRLKASLPDNDTLFRKASDSGSQFLSIETADTPSFFADPSLLQ